MLRRMSFDPEGQFAERPRTGKIWQVIATVYCMLFGLAIILNVEMGGEAMWFWYATLLHRGVKLYSDLHLVLQPLYVLETNTWMQLVGVRCIPYEGLAVLHLAGLCVSILLVLRESDWPDWQKAVLLFGTFLIVIRFTAYRFDDFHVLADIFYLLGMVLLLWVARAASVRKEINVSIALGILSGLAITNRLTDGGFLTLAIAGALPLIARRRRWAACVSFVAAVALTWLLVVLLTGDTLHAYAMNSVLKASSAKGGTSNLLKGPVVAILDSYKRIYIGTKRKLAVFALLGLLGALVQKFWKKDARLILLVQVAAAYLLSFVPHLPGELPQLLGGAFIETLSTVVQPLAYLLCLVVGVRALLASTSSGAGRTWDSREAVVLIPAGSLLSAAISQGNGTWNSTITVALLFLLVPSFFRKGERSWQRATFLMLLVLAGTSGTLFKWKSPYDWGSATTKPMFAGREWYRHPLYGPMYLDATVLRYNRDLCAEIGATDTERRKSLQLLSLPFPYANYFCGVSPWRNHVQLWYDTVTPGTVAKVMQQLDSDPPEWILYQRSPATIKAHEDEYNHGRPIPHRYLDLEIVHFVVDGRWSISEQSRFKQGEAWYLFRTR